MNHWENWFQNAKNGVFHRQLLVLSGSQHWAYKNALKIVQDCNEKCIWLGNDAFFTVRGFPTKQYQKILGKDCKIAVFDGYKGISPSAFLALSGTIASGGILILCCPSWEEWKYQNEYVQDTLISHGFSASKSIFIERWQQIMLSDPFVTVCYKESGLDVPNLKLLPNDTSEQGFFAPYATSDQQRAYEAICTSQLDSNFLITARRGRGKSALLGMVASTLAKSGRNVYLCTPHKSNAENVFAFAENLTDIEWLPPDSPKLRQPHDVLIIDEVASLPVATVLEIASHCQNFIFATTTEGYEGTGRGFHTKLVPKLKSCFLKLQTLHMQSPIRFGRNDALESHLDKVFLLDQKITKATPHDNANATLKMKQYPVSEYIPEQDFQHAVNLLSHAHYQTTPEDIMRFMDSPDNFFISLHLDNILVGIAVICEEGNNKLIGVEQDVASGQRRVKGHQFAQKLCLLISEPNSLARKYWRINRIAIHPDFQNQQIGSRFLASITSLAQSNSVDSLCASFGMTTGTERFWLKNGFTAISEGAMPDKTTGEVSLFVIKHLTHYDGFSVENLHDCYLADQLNFAALNLESIAENQMFDDFVQDVYRRRILDYVNETRSYMHMGNAISHWLVSHTVKLEAEARIYDECRLLSDKWISRMIDTDLQQKYCFSNRKRLYAELQLAFQKCYWQMA